MFEECSNSKAIFVSAVQRRYLLLLFTHYFSETMRKLQTGSCMLERYFLSVVVASVSNLNRLLPIILNYLERVIVAVLHFYNVKTNIRLHYPSWSFYQ